MGDRVKDLMTRIDGLLRQRPCTTDELVRETGSDLYNVLHILHTWLKTGNVFQYAGKWELR
jgi:hypothetical protein